VPPLHSVPFCSSFPSRLLGALALRPVFRLPRAERATADVMASIKGMLASSCAVIRDGAESVRKTHRRTCTHNARTHAAGSFGVRTHARIDTRTRVHARTAHAPVLYAHDALTHTRTRARIAPPSLAAHRPSHARAWRRRAPVPGRPRAR
jgi:hypothetical protein